jgi:GNAT superfamily N-acetyltransferase
MTYARRYVPADWWQLIAMVREFHAESPVHSRFPLDEQRIAEIANNASSDRNWLLAVAVDDGALVGVTVLFNFPMFFSPAGEIGDLCFYVTPRRRGTRAAQILLEYAHQWAVTTDASVIRLGITTGICDSQVEKFLLRHGYEPCGQLLEKDVPSLRQALSPP